MRTLIIYIPSVVNKQLFFVKIPNRLILLLSEFKREGSLGVSFGYICSHITFKLIFHPNDSF